MNTLLQSSSDPKKLSLTVNGLIIAVAGFIVMKLAEQGINIEATQIVSMINDLAMGLGEVTKVIGGFIALFGALRKGYNNVKK